MLTRVGVIIHWRECHLHLAMRIMRLCIQHLRAWNVLVTGVPDEIGTEFQERRECQSPQAVPPGWVVFILDSAATGFPHLTA